MTEAPSPITNNPSKAVDSFDISTIIDGYKKDIGISVAHYFADEKPLQLYECPDTGLRFFSPATMAGDGDFYQTLEDRQGYYDDWKWDYETAYPFIKPNSKVLDIGCGRGAFIKKLQKEKNCTVQGLELNPSAYRNLQQQNIPVEMKTIEEYASLHKNEYDAVVFFQVLEHIANIKSFLDSAIDCLKPGGTLIIAVPNNEPYLYGFEKYNWLNLPPHHMGWWNKKSLTNLAKFFPITPIEIKPAAFKDYNNYLKGKQLNLQIQNPEKLWWFRLTQPIKKQWIQIFRKKIPGVFILAAYRKNDKY